MLKTTQDWNREWDLWFDHYQQDKRHAYYINAVLEDEVDSVLEIAAGSFRDTNTLNILGRNCYGIDFSQSAVSKAKELFPSIASKITMGDAMKLPYEDKFFEASFHNGFWVLLSKEQIKQSLLELIRCTKKTIIATVHNRHNEQFYNYFEKQKLTDPLFDIRFFTKDELIDIMKPHCKEIKIIPVGKRKMYYEDDLINIGLYDAKYLRKEFEFHKENLIECSERLMCIGKLE